MELARSLFKTGNLVKALKETQGLSDSEQGRDRLEGMILLGLAENTRNHNMKMMPVLYGAALCLSRDNVFPVYVEKARVYFNLARQSGSMVYYKKASKNANKALGVLGKSDLSKKKLMIDIIATANREVIRDPNPKKTYHYDEPLPWSYMGSEEFQVLKTFWLSLKDDIKRSYMIIRIKDLENYVWEKKGQDALVALEKVLRFAKKNSTWFVWVCRTCSKKFIGPEACKDHIAEEHVRRFIPSLGKHMPQRISKGWADKLSAGSWEPLDAVASFQKISEVEAFVYQNGWCKDWPVAADPERRELLKEIRSLLVSFNQSKLLTDSIRDRVIHLVLNNVKVMPFDCRLVETPQSICFLECHELKQLLTYLTKIKCETDDRTHLVDLVCRVSSSQNTRVRERLDFDKVFSSLLLDKRLLRGGVDRFDSGKVKSSFDPTSHYANIRSQGSQGDVFLTWLNQDFGEEDGFEFPKPIETHQLDLWVGGLRAVQFTGSYIETKYKKKLQILDYLEALREARELCKAEINRKPGEENLLAPLLCKVCEKSDTRKLFLCAVRDIFKAEVCGTFGLQSSEDSLQIIRDWSEKIECDDDTVFKFIEHLESKVREKVSLLDLKILLAEKSQMELIKVLPNLAFFDLRSYIHGPLKSFLRDALKRGIIPDR